jgi:hypothetical protein
MFEAILHERQIELAFEGKRFWDLRRWKQFESKLNGKRRTGVTINLKTSAISAENFAARRDGMSLDSAYRNYFEIVPKHSIPSTRSTGCRSIISSPFHRLHCLIMPDWNKISAGLRGRLIL